MCLCKDCLDTCNQSIPNYVRDGTGNMSQLVEEDDNVSTIDEDDECSSKKKEMVTIVKKTTLLKT